MTFDEKAKIRIELDAHLVNTVPVAPLLADTGTSAEDAAIRVAEAEAFQHQLREVAAARGLDLADPGARARAMRSVDEAGVAGLAAGVLSGLHGHAEGTASPPPEGAL
jgi:hypothetical protein